jgi:hypothetical protein
LGPTGSPPRVHDGRGFAIYDANCKIADVGGDGVATVALEVAITVQFYTPLGLKRP